MGFSYLSLGLRALLVIGIGCVRPVRVITRRVISPAMSSYEIP